MAELGILASSLQLADTALRLKQLWSEIRDAPKDVEELVEELVVQAEALDDLRRFHQSTTHIDMGNAGWERCYLLFKASAEALERVTHDLKTLLTKHKRTGSVRVFLRNNDLSRCKERFQRVQMTMMSSQQAYFGLFAAQNFSMILSEIRTISAHTQLVPKTADIATLESDAGLNIEDNDARKTAILPRRVNTKGEHSQDTWSYQLQLPRWILRKGLDVAIRRSSASWGVTFRTYNRVRSDSPVVIAAKTGDCLTMQRLFASRQASPFDVDEFGKDLISYAVGEFQLAACQLLIDSGLDIAPSKSLLLSMCTGKTARCQNPDPSLIARVSGILSLLAKDGIELFFEDSGFLFPSVLLLPTPLLSTVVTTVIQMYKQLEQSIRVETAFVEDGFDPDRMQLLLGCDLSMEKSFKLAKASNLSTDHLTVLSDLGAACGRISSRREAPESWLDALRSVIDFESKNQTAHQYRSSALKNFFNGYNTSDSPLADVHSGMNVNEIFTKKLRVWINILQQSGASLGRYAAAERLFISGGHFQGQFLRLSSRRGHVWFRVRHISTGKRVEDWRVYVIPRDFRETVEYEMSGEFWYWVENPELFNIPGSYVEDEYMYDDDDCLKYLPPSYTVYEPIL